MHDKILTKTFLAYLSFFVGGEICKLYTLSAYENHFISPTTTCKQLFSLKIRGQTSDYQVDKFKLKLKVT